MTPVTRVDVAGTVRQRCHPPVLETAKLPMGAALRYVEQDLHQAADTVGNARRHTREELGHALARSRHYRSGSSLHWRSNRRCFHRRHRPLAGLGSPGWHRILGPNARCGINGAMTGGKTEPVEVDKIPGCTGEGQIEGMNAGNRIDGRCNRVQFCHPPVVWVVTPQ